MMLRSESTRYAELADLRCTNLLNEGTDRMALVVRSNRGKIIALRDVQDTRKTHYHGTIRQNRRSSAPLAPSPPDRFLDGMWLTKRHPISATVRHGAIQAHVQHFRPAKGDHERAHASGRCNLLPRRRGAIQVLREPRTTSEQNGTQLKFNR